MCSVLELLPSPLPGCQTPGQLLPLLTWALQLMQSPRMSESDAGARTVQLLVSKYLLGLGWTLTAAPEVAVSSPAGSMEAAGQVSTHTPAGCMEAAGQLSTKVGTQQQDRGSSTSTSTHTGGSSVDSRVAGAVGEQQDRVQAVVTLLGSLSRLLRQQLASAKADITAASRHGLVHGTLLCLKYCVRVLPWAELASSGCTAALAVPAAVAAACGTAGSSSGSVAAIGGSSGSIDSGAAAAAVGGSIGSSVAAAPGSSSGSGSDQQLVMVHGPAPVVLHCWVTDLVALLTEVADLVKPLLSAQVGDGTFYSWGRCYLSLHVGSPKEEELASVLGGSSVFMLLTLALPVMPCFTSG